jgi:deoxyribodipyrimidine photolyase-related protein
MAKSITSYKTLRLILGDQLNASHSWFSQIQPDTLYVIAELKQEATYVQHHKQKIAVFFAAMEQFSQALKAAGHQVLYLTLDDTEEFKGLPALIKHLSTLHQVIQFDYQLPDEYRLRQQLEKLGHDLSIISQACDSEHFYLPDDEIKNYFEKGKRHRLENFYRKMRKRFDVLMEDSLPVGGEWNFDQNNRNKLKPADLAEIPAPLLFTNDISIILARIEKHGIKTIGYATEEVLWPINRKQAQQLLVFFCQTCLPKFGKFQDSMTGKLSLLDQDNGWSLYHSRISFALNSKILSPKQVIDTAIASYHASDGTIDISQIEGFVRQIIGWREFVRGIYWANMPDYAKLNNLAATRQLPSWFWDAKTDMNCLHHAIKQSLEFSYAHHIQRLMVTGNFCLLTGVDPDQVDDWYLGIYIDAIEWVEMPNTRGMSQFADGGIVGSKAYAASGNYIKKMSDYCGDCSYQVNQIDADNACPLNSLYWNFMQSHQATMASNPRTKMVYNNWLKKPEEDKQRILNKAQFYLDNIENL